jgi:hypothetical protein
MNINSSLEKNYLVKNKVNYLCEHLYFVLV